MKFSLVFIFVFLCIVSVYPQQVSTDIRLNQVGFLPNAEKLAVVKSTTDTLFEVKTSDLSTTVFTGVLGPQVNWSASSENIKIADFSSFSTPGEYVVVIPQKGKSYPFKIDAHVFESLSKGSIKAFYFNRASTALTTEYAGVYARAAGHPDNAVVVLPSAASANRPAGTTISTPYGWYDAGDYNKYVVNSGISTFTLLNAYESYPRYYDTLTWNIPESGNDIPDILDEALWNINWLFTMQDPDDGGVYNKTTNANFDGFVMPAQATSTRYVVAKGTAATLDFAAIMAMTARIYKDYLPTFADEALAKAELAWQWANANPNVPFNNPAASGGYPAVNTGGYGDNNFSDEFAWAAAELYITTLDDIYYNTLNISSANYDIPGWPNVRTMGLLSLITNRKNLTATADTSTMKTKLVNVIQSTKNSQQTSPYRIPINNFFWGSNSDDANRGMLLIHAYRLTNDKDYFTAALAALDYLVGRNATTYSFVTGFGSNTPKNIHHRPSGADGIAEPIPGFLAGGPNPQNTADDCGTSAYPSTLPARCYLDSECSYSTNEIAINWNAPLAFLSGAVQAEYLKTFSQAPQKFLSVSKRLVTIPYTGSEVQASVLSNGTWTLTADQPWIVVSPADGEGNQTISISAETANNESMVRTGKIVIQGEGVLIDSILVKQDVITGVEDMNSGIKVYPIPATNKLRFDANFLVKGVSLTSVRGTVAVKKDITNPEQYELDVSGLTPGLYFLKLEGKTQVYYRKVVIDSGSH